MPAYPLDQVLAAFLCALTEAQSLSDRYSSTLQQETDGTSQVRVPRTQLGRVELDLKFAVSDVRWDHGNARDSGTPLPAGLKVLVDASDLRELPAWEVSNLHVGLRVEDTEALELPQEG